MPEVNTIILIAGLGLNFIVTVVAGTWKLSRVEISLREHIDHSKRTTEERIEREARGFGETVSALRSGLNLEVAAIRKEITEEQKYVRDTFMRRDSFYKVQEAVQGDIRSLGTELKARLERMETKIDSKT